VASILIDKKNSGRVRKNSVRDGICETGNVHIIIY